MLLARNSTCDYDQLCRLDVLRIEDLPSGDEEFAYREIKDQLQRHPEGFYETSLIWNVGHPTLDNNKAGNLLCLKSLLVKKDPAKSEHYDNIIKDQLTEIIERVTSQQSGKDYYIPHKPVIRENAESTKMSHNEPHLGSKKGENINKIAEIKQSLYVDDYISGGINATGVRKLKQLIINIVGEAQFIFHKWYSNIPESEDENNSKDIQACAKVQLGVERNETKILGLVKLAILSMLLFQN